MFQLTIGDFIDRLRSLTLMKTHHRAYSLRWHWIYYLSSGFIGARWMYWIFLIRDNKGHIGDYGQKNDRILRVVCLQILNKNTLLIYSIGSLIIFSIYLDGFVYHKLYVLFEPFLLDIWNFSEGLKRSGLRTIDALKNYSTTEVQESIRNIIQSFRINEQICMTYKEKVKFFYIFYILQYAFYYTSITVLLLPIVFIIYYMSMFTLELGTPWQMARSLQDILGMYQITMTAINESYFMILVQTLSIYVALKSLKCYHRNLESHFSIMLARRQFDVSQKYTLVQRIHQGHWLFVRSLTKINVCYKQMIDHFYVVYFWVSYFSNIAIILSLSDDKLDLVTRIMMWCITFVQIAILSFWNHCYLLISKAIYTSSKLVTNCLLIVSGRPTIGLLHVLKFNNFHEMILTRSKCKLKLAVYGEFTSKNQFFFLLFYSTVYMHLLPFYNHRWDQEARNRT